MFPFNLIKNVLFPNRNKDMQLFAETETDKEFDPQEKITILPEKKSDESVNSENYILVNGKKNPVDFKVIQKPLPSNCFTKSKKLRKPNVIVTHWDVALSADSCFNILSRAKISSHFCIDNDGTIFQFVDTNDIAWHAGPTSTDRQMVQKFLEKNFSRDSHKKIPSWNNNSIGIDFSNAYYLKYQNTYIKRGFGPRPELYAKVHNRNIGPFLGFYPAQIESYKKLLKFLSNHYSIPLKTPKSEHGTLHTVDENAVFGEFNGVINHYNLTPNKIDCVGLELDMILLEILKEEKHG